MQEEREKEDEVLSMSMLMKQSSKFISDQDHNIDSLIWKFSFLKKCYLQITAKKEYIFMQVVNIVKANYYIKVQLNNMEIFSFFNSVLCDW